MKDNQHEQLFTELTAEFEAPAFTELDDEVAGSCSGGVAYTGSNDPDVILFNGNNSTGSSLKINASIGDGIRNLGAENFNNKTTSISIIRGRWTLYDGTGFNKPLRTLSPGQYNFSGTSVNNDFSSLLRIG